MSASSMPTRWPWVASATARFVAVVDLPTPPLAEAMATTPRAGRVTASAYDALNRMQIGQGSVDAVVAADGDPVGVRAELGRVLGRPAVRRERVVVRRGEAVLGCEAVLDGEDAPAERRGEPRQQGPVAPESDGVVGAEQVRFSGGKDDVAQGGGTDASRIDAQLSRTPFELVDLGRLIGKVVRTQSTRESGPQIRFTYARPPRGSSARPRRPMCRCRAWCSPRRSACPWCRM